MKLLGFTIGMLLVLAGLITVWLPIPTGVPLLMIGIPILTQHSSRARKLLGVLARRFPVLHRFIRNSHQDK